MNDNIKIYYTEKLNKPLILENKEYKGYEYYIITLGSHPCCYVLLPEGHCYHGEHYDDIPIKCHFGLTYSEPTLFRNNIIENGEWVIGWDYAHIGDYSIFHLPLMESSIDGHKWTLDELRCEVYEVIDQLVEISEKRFVYGETDLFEWVEDNGEMISTKECVNKLNELYEGNKRLKHINEQLEEEVKENEKLRKDLNDCEKVRYEVFKIMGELSR